MAIIKCKMCGGDLNLIEGASTAECEFCGSVQTVPKADDEKRLTLFARANRLRAACDFDKAAGIYEAIIADFPEEAEAYWGLVLCKYGIEYVDDPVTGKKIPTCHRSSFHNILEDSDLEQALENADMAALKVYRAEAKEFERIRKGIVEVSSTEKPYDIFICYKETDEKGNRTLDSVLAQDLYSALTDKGYRVFFSRITLQGKLGEAYEPYIFAALNSAKVMLAVGSRYEYYNAVWVKNEWSRYLKICQADNSKHLIPCYKDLDPEDMPKEFNHLQGADLGKMGAIQDILFNMEKYIPLQKHRETVVVQQAATGSNPTVESYLKRAFMFLEDGDWKSADEYCEKVLDIDPENAEAYLGKLMAEMKAGTPEDLKDCARSFGDNPNYQKVLRFGSEKLKAPLTYYQKQAEAAAKIREKREAEEAAAAARIRRKQKAAETEADFRVNADIENGELTKYRGTETEIFIPYSVTSIGDFAFSDCEAITFVAIPDSVTSIGEYAFSGCKALTSVTIPDGVTSIGISAFEGCEALTSITIPNSVTDIGEGAFCGCSLLKSVSVSAGNQNFRVETGCLIDVQEKTVIWGSADAVIPDDGSVTGIGNWAFSDCKALASIIVPDNVTNIGEGAFSGCGLLRSVTVSAENQNFRMKTGCLIDIREKKVIWGTADAMIPEDGSVTSIGDWAFFRCEALTSIVIPYGVTSIGEYAFSNSKSLVSITIPDSITTITGSVFCGCEALASVTIPDSVTSIGNWAFSDCEALTSITIPDSVTDISKWAFSGCTKLTIYTPLRSYAEKWAKENRVPVREDETSKQKRQAENTARRTEYEAKLAAAAAKKAEEERRMQQYRAAGRCQHCGGALKGLFSKKCVSCGRPKDY